MVSINIQGGIGNILFQCAALYGHAKRHGFDYGIPLENANPHYEGQKPYIFPGLNYIDKLPDLPGYNEPFFHYAGIPDLDDVVLRGYFQSHKYFEDCKEEFINALKLDIKTEPGIVSLHKRLGDYKKLQNFHPVASDGYMANAIKYFDNLGYKKFRVFSDGIEELMESLSTNEFSKYEFEFSEGRTEIEDLVYMASCEHNVICNSTFSWWAQFLNPNPNKIVVAPQKENWFGPAAKHNDVKDIYMQNWILL